MSDVRDGDIVRGKVKQAWMAKSKNKGTPSVHVVFEIDEEQEVHTDIWLTEKAMGMARQQLKVLGVDPDRVTLGQLSQGIDRLKNRECDVQIEMEEYQGTMQTKCRIFTGHGGGERPSDAELDKLTLALRAAASDESKTKAEKKDGKPSAPPPPQRKPAPPPATQTRSAAPEKFTQETIDRARAAGVGSEDELDPIPF